MVFLKLYKYAVDGHFQILYLKIYQKKYFETNNLSKVDLGGQ